MGLFSSMMRSRQSHSDKLVREHMAFLESMSARDRADIGLKPHQFEKVARQMMLK
jgi:uncharacterized protein YjiS (DUF1127 family)